MKLFHVSDESRDWIVMALTADEARSIVVASIPDLNLTTLEHPIENLDVEAYEGPIVAIDSHVRVR